MKNRAQPHKLLALSFQKLSHWNSTPARDHLGNLIRINYFLEERIRRILLEVAFMDLEFLLELRNHSVLEPRRSLIITARDRLLAFITFFVKTHTDPAHVFKRSLLGLPLCSHRIALNLKRCELLLQFFKPLLRCLVLLLLERNLLNFKTAHMSRDFVKFLGTRIHLRANARTSLIEQIDRFIRKETILNVARGKHNRTHQRLITNMDVMIFLKTLLNPAEYRNRVLFRRGIDHHRLETALKRLVLLHVLPVFVKSRRTNAMKFAAGKHRLEHISGIGTTFGLTRADDSMDFIDKKNNPSLGILHLLKDRLKTFLKLSTI